MGVRIEPMTVSDLAEVLADHDRYWDGRNVRFLHQPVFVREFGDTCLTARGEGGRIAGYLLGFTTPHRVGYIHAVAVRDDARGTGCAQALYGAFARDRDGAGSGPAEGDHHRDERRLDRIPPSARLRHPAGR
jgi:predicted GNAT superfamily acetyltransferase